MPELSERERRKVAKEEEMFQEAGRRAEWEAREEEAQQWWLDTSYTIRSQAKTAWLRFP